MGKVNAKEKSREGGSRASRPGQPGSKLQSESPLSPAGPRSLYRLSSHVLLAFWAFYSVVMVTAPRAPPPERWLAERGGRQGVHLRGGPALREALCTAPRAAPHLESAAALSCQRRPGPGSPAEAVRPAAQTAARTAAAVAPAPGRWGPASLPPGPRPAAGTSPGGA